ncbi:hypothetical protein INR77_12265 [Erythrobacter sp. SCSIO 43205]|uniref:hypothetical protein n=1 Tax=Erythrobacter sp. SCSIO 43205 TaxID=2779361 RepID=UPI001CAA2B94|nr:hypothetical protein [Erythrobacter sp. SCSIO 43205]UAB77559.1 hypothetical protein INR77_12265 [Erythrobacter sp. SCSIO 43205]
MRLITVTALASSLALAACGSETEGEFTTEDGESGEYRIDQSSGESSMTVETEDGTVSMVTNSDAPTNLPAGFTMISGAQVLSNTMIDDGETKGSLTTFRSEKSPEEIAAHYREQAEEAGITIQIETNLNGGKMLGGENEATGTTFSVSAYPDDEGVVTGQLTISEEPG